MKSLIVSSVFLKSSTIIMQIFHSFYVLWQLIYKTISYLFSNIYITWQFLSTYSTHKLTVSYLSSSLTYRLAIQFLMTQCCIKNTAPTRTPYLRYIYYIGGSTYISNILWILVVCPFELFRENSLIISYITRKSSSNNDSDLSMRDSQTTS